MGGFFTKRAGMNIVATVSAGKKQVPCPIEAVELVVWANQDVLAFCPCC
jgi:hypothetical protein